MADDADDAPDDSAADLREDLLQSSIRAVLATNEGKRVFLWVLEQCAVYGQMFTGDADRTHLQLGRREVGLRIISKLDAMNRDIYPGLLLDAVKLETAFEDLHAHLRKAPD